MELAESKKGLHYATQDDRLRGVVELLFESRSTGARSKAPRLRFRIGNTNWLENASMRVMNANRIHQMNTKITGQTGQ